MLTAKFFIICILALCNSVSSYQSKISEKRFLFLTLVKCQKNEMSTNGFISPTNKISLATVMVLPVLFFGILSATSPAAALSIEDRVVILEKTMLTKQDFELARAEEKKDTLLARAEDKVESAANKAETELKAQKAKTETEAKMALMLRESRAFAIATLAVALGTPYAMFVGMVQKESRDNEKERKKEEKEAEKERKKEEKEAEKEREKEEKAKRSIKNDFDSFFNYFNTTANNN